MRRALRRPKLFVPFAMAIGILAACAAGAQSGRGSATADGVQPGDSIRAEVKGHFRTAAGIGTEHTGFQITANGMTWEVDVAADSTLLDAAGRLAGRLAVVRGTYAERRDARNVRRILTAQALEAGVDGGRPEYIDVTVRGVLKTGILAIGAETTGVTITASNVTWELALDDRQRDAAEALSGCTAVVSGELRRQSGVERGTRFIVTVRRLD